MKDTPFKIKITINDETFSWAKKNSNGLVFDEYMDAIRQLSKAIYHEDLVDGYWEADHQPPPKSSKPPETKGYYSNSVGTPLG